MSFLGWAIAVGVTGLFIKKAKESAQESAEKKAEEERRRNTPCYFDDGFSEDEFQQMVKRASKKIKRLSDVSTLKPQILR